MKDKGSLKKLHSKSVKNKTKKNRISQKLPSRATEKPSNCMKTFCIPNEKKNLQEDKKMIQDIKDKIKEINEKLNLPSQATEKPSKTNLNEKEKNKLMKRLSIYKIQIKLIHLFNLKNKTKKISHWRLKVCKDTYCNPKCKNTLFEEGKKMSKRTINEYRKRFSYHNFSKKNKEMLLNKLKEVKRKTFAKKKNVLINDFYEKLNEDDIKKVKQQGAISGCTADGSPILRPKGKSLFFRQTKR